jgi:transposase
MSCQQANAFRRRNSGRFDLIPWLNLLYNPFRERSPTRQPYRHRPHQPQLPDPPGISRSPHKRVKGRKRHILVDTLSLLVANRVEPADTSDRRAGALLLGGLSALFPRIRTIIADAGHESCKLARTLKQHEGWQLRIVKRRQRAFKITGLTWIVERSFAWLGRNRGLSKDYEYRVQTSETMIDLAAIRLMLNRIAPV